jgi:hypothetical protein
MRILQFFSEDMIALNREILEHPELQENLSYHPNDTWDVRLGRIAEYVGIVLDEVVSTDEEVDAICEACTRLLRKRREIIITPPIAH